MEKEKKQQYLDFDRYIRQGEAGQKERAEAWKIAIGLQDVDGLKTSEYLQQTALRNVEGEITIDEARELVRQYYITRTARDTESACLEEADKVSANITKILSTDTLDFSAKGFISLHRRIFDGVFEYAGIIRGYDIAKREWVLDGDSVSYLNWEDLRNALEYDIEMERSFNYKGLSQDEMISHIAGFVSGLWQIHAFGEGWDLRNRYLHIHPTPEGQVQPNLANTKSAGQVQDKFGTSSSQVQDKFHTDNPNICLLVDVMKGRKLSVKEIMEGMGLKGRDNFLKLYLIPAMNEGYIRLLYPKSPRHPRQKYLLTAKGLMLLESLPSE